MFSIIAPIDTNRLEQFHQTKLAYDAMPEVKEFVMPTRNYIKVLEYLEAHDLTKDVRLIPYTHEIGFNPSKALNIGVRNATYKNIIITSPEVKPHNDLLNKLSKMLDKNVVCQVYDQNEEGNLVSLVNEGYRNGTPAMYFLAMFKKEDIEAVLNEGPISYKGLADKLNASFMIVKKSCNEQGIFLNRYYGRKCANKLGKSVEIIAELIRNPQATLAEISRKLDVSREYVSQIYSKR
jgi:hypothetical protein